MIDQILLKDSIEFNGTISELKEKIRLKREREFKLEWIDQNDFKFLSKFSLGTLIVDGFPGATDGIKGYGKLSETENGNTRIELKTKMRIELYFTSFVFVFIFFLLLYGWRKFSNLDLFITSCIASMVLVYF